MAIMNLKPQGSKLPPINSAIKKSAINTEINLDESH